MSLSHQTVLQLMALADGELHGADRERAEQLVAENEEARRIVETMRGGEINTWLGETMLDRAAGADGIAGAVMAKIGSGAVVSLADRRARKSPRWQVMVTAATATVALAAGVAAYVHSASVQPNERAPVASVGIPPVDFQASSALAQQAGPAGADGVEVNEIDAPSRGVSVFEIPAAAAAAAASPQRGSSVVVWVDEDPSESR
jgi:hypothetical protein